MTDQEAHDSVARNSPDRCRRDIRIGSFPAYAFITVTASVQMCVARRGARKPCSWLATTASLDLGATAPFR